MIIEVFLVCFRRNGDLLSQWHAHGPAGGYALGFDSGVLIDDSELKIDFRERKGMLASYSPIPLPGVTDKVVPVRHIVHGPMRDPNLAGSVGGCRLSIGTDPRHVLHRAPADMKA